MGAIALAGLLLAALIARGVALPAPTGPHAVGRVTYRWTDPSRPEVMTADPGDRRALVVHVWYPAGEAAEHPATPYLPDADALRAALAASPDYGWLKAWAVDLVRAHARSGPPVAAAETAYPVLIFLPGNRTNAGTYAALLEDLASHGYIVAAVDHPYDVAAALMPDGRVAAFAEHAWPAPATRQLVAEDPRAEIYRARVDVRAQDAAFVLAQLARAAGPLSGRLDLARVGVLGHSVGGVAAARACQLVATLRACLNLDGLTAGLPFYPDEAGRGPTQPFLLLTKRNEVPPPTAADLERLGLTLAEWQARAAEAEARTAQAFRSVAGGSYRVTLPTAAHDSFTDAPLLRAGLIPNATAEAQAQTIRAFVRAFMDHYVRGEGVGPMPAVAGAVEAQVEVFAPEAPGRDAFVVFRSAAS